MVSQVLKTDAHWPPLEESMGQDRFALTSDGLSSSSLPAPQPMDGLQNTAPPPFLTKTYDMVDDPATDAVVSWSSGNNSFVVWNPPEFAQELLPKYFKHNNFSSFVRQLNTYGFRKVDPDRWEFANEGFLRGRRDLLRGIHRRKPATHSQQPPQQQQQPQSEQSSAGPCVEVGKIGLEGEIERLKSDKNVLMLELVRLRQQQQNTERELQSMGQRLIATENRQQHMMSFLAKAMQNPSFLAQLMQQSESNKRLAATVRKKRRLPKQDGGEEDSLSNDAQPEGQIVAFQPNSTVDPNGTRAMIMQFFNSTDASSPSLDSGPLEALFRDLGSAPSGQDVALNRQSGVTLTEMNISGLADSLPVNPLVRDVAKEPLDLPLPSLRIPRLEGALSLENGNRYPIEESKVNGEMSGTDSMEINGDAGRLPPEMEEESSNIGSPAVSASGTNDIFWEQFLSGSPAVTDHELDLGPTENESDGVDSIAGGAEIVGHEHDVGQVKDWWHSKSNVDQLADRMGQLAPG